MFDFHDFYRSENAAVADSYQASLEQIREICSATAGSNQSGKKEYRHLFHTIGTHILKLARLEAALGEDYFKDTSLEQLQQENQALYHELLPVNYVRSYADPRYCVQLFGDEFGSLLAVVYQHYRRYIHYAHQHERFEMTRWNQLFISTWEYVSREPVQFEELKQLVTSIQRSPTAVEVVRQQRQTYDPQWQPWLDAVLKADPQDLRYLFRYGARITDNEIRTARFLHAYPSNLLEELAQQIVTAYLNGFIRDNKERGERDTVSLRYSIGQEPLARLILAALETQGLRPVVGYPNFTPVNRQYSYDHRNQAAYWVDAELLKLAEGCHADACAQNQQLLERYSGTIVLDVFGEPPFSPEVKPECPLFNDEQKQLINQHNYRSSEIIERYRPRRSISFSVIAFPSPQIGDRFEEIFADILRVNMQDSAEYEEIQQRIIDTLDQAEYVHIQGQGANRTDFKVRLQPLADPERQTNFCNCGADVNIPAGEVFTSPQLAGTEGLLHVTRTYLNGLRYDDLELHFAEGMVEGYDCANFADDAENRQYIEDNLLFPHKTLPLGEFAIGSNTLAWVIAQKYDIQKLLPILIVEKMGPHFAVGDTCWAREEDHQVFNSLDGKEIVARENEKTSQRKTDPMQAYTFCHTDITLPYDEIGSIAAVTPAGERTEIIRAGRFVLPGTERLNQPLDEAEGSQA